MIEWGFTDDETPIAGDYNLDGIDDIGLWLPDSPFLGPAFPTSRIKLATGSANGTS